MPDTETAATTGYTHVDDKGRVTLSKPIRQALHLDAGSTLAWITIGDAVLLVPQDAHLAELMESAVAAFERAGLSLANVDAELEAIRAQTVAEHYGAGFFEELRRSDAVEQR